MKLRTITNSLLTIVTVILLLFVLLNVLSAPQGKGLFGFKGYTVLSNSMKPVFRAGDYVIDRMAAFDSIETDDIITYQAEDQTIVTHRVVEKMADAVTVQGDQNDTPDQETVTKSNYIGKQIIVIPYLGTFMMKMQNPLIFALLCGLIALFFVWSFFKRD
ncbi:signal peptidase I [Enterococcus sp. 8G7_MSG3316]|uniref:Signal peptidase I n=1 Tax=Candidatus Enterococcus testudinis TaxID=1834191 RepID=A0A242A4Y9_9ENTE|nr:signal peptidase I [Enterococcus sp. 8G7_MSG3316]OTN75960.1 signal peptidase I [Enterococcus sp. 8G7_MSG3316]